MGIQVFKSFRGVGLVFRRASCGSEEEERDALGKESIGLLEKAMEGKQTLEDGSTYEGELSKGNQMVMERERFPPAAFSKVSSKTVLLTVTDRAFTNPMRKSIATRVFGQAGKKRVLEL